MKKQAGHKRPRIDGRRRNAIERRKYMTVRWSRVRGLVLSRDNGLCQNCLRLGKTEPGNQIDHVIAAEKRPDLFWHLDNLQTLCHSCHSEKTGRGE